MKLTTTLKTAIFVALTAAGVTIFAAAAVQQNYRQSANDPQIQIASDARAAFERGTSPADIVGTSKVDLSSSLAPFSMIFDANHNLVATNATATVGNVPTPPAGVFDSVKKNGHDSFTWQTATGDRYATVMYYTASSRPGGSHRGYVLAARNLLEVEKREDSLRLMALLTLVGVAVVAGAFLLIK